MNLRSLEEIKNIEIKNLKYWSSHYAKEADKIQEQLKLFGFDKNDLLVSNSCNKLFNNLVSVSQYLKMDSFKIYNFTASIRDLLTEKCEDEATILKLENETTKFKDRLKKLNIFHEHLVKDYKTLSSQLHVDKQKTEEMMKNLEFMQTKIEKYNAQLEQLESYNRTIDPELYHESIVNDYKHLKEFEAKIDNLKTEVNRYFDLPPDIERATLRVQLLRNEVDKMDQEIENIMNRMH